MNRVSAFFRPVRKPSATDVYLEIGRRRWEGRPAIILANAILFGPFMLGLCIGVLACSVPHL